jgi:hypothetical protein
MFFFIVYGQNLTTAADSEAVNWGMLRSDREQSCTSDLTSSRCLQAAGTNTDCVMLYCFLDASAKLRKAATSNIMSVCPSIRPSAWNSAPTGRIFMKFDIEEFFENLSMKFKFH